MNKILNKLAKELSFQTGRYMLSPEFLSLVITMKCNFKCQSCSIWQKPFEKELEQEDWVKIIEKLTHTLKPNTFVEINGGEPLIRKDLVIFLIKELKKHFNKVALNSNGLLVNETNLDELKQAGLDLIKISLYSLEEEVHNSMRGHSLAFQHAKRAVELITQKQIPLEIGLLVTTKNIKTAPALIQYLQKLPNTSIILQPLDEKIESAESKDQKDNNLIPDLWPEKEDVVSFFDWVEKHNQGIKNSLPNIKAIRQYYLNPPDILKYRCFAGQRNLVIYPGGDVAFCFKRKAIGNINNQDIELMLKNASGERKQIKYCQIVGCNFSRGLKEAIHDRITK
ncbi:MAG: radical SAM protein [Patescibacteria group bacterium]